MTVVAPSHGPGWWHHARLSVVAGSLSAGTNIALDITGGALQAGALTAANGDITEVFACGTAAIVTPVGELVWDAGTAPSTAGEAGGEVTRGVRRRLLDIQQGRVEDPYGWMHRLV